jgi:hypothetical protein
MSKTNANLPLLARNFRKAMSRIAPDDFHFGLFSSFPKNCCEFTSYLLAKYLHERCHYKRVLMVHGENRYKKTIRHTWLKIGEVDIDITADQFASSDRTVFVVADSVRHKRFIIFKSEIPNTKFDHFHEEQKLELLSDYKKVIANMQKSWDGV